MPTAAAVDAELPHTPTLSILTAITSHEQGRQDGCPPVQHALQHANTLVTTTTPSPSKLVSSPRSTTSNSVAAYTHASHAGHHRLRLCCDDVTVGASLTHVSAMLHSGRVTALVSCSLTHTSSTSAAALLSVLAGREEEVACGHVVLNGTPVSAPSYQARCAFLANKDECGCVVLDELSVREGLEYTAAMRLTRRAQASQQQQQQDSDSTVDEVIAQLMLEDTQHTRLQQCSDYVQRRVWLGHELLLDPLVVLLDDPLRGLATHEAQQYLNILHHIAAPHHHHHHHRAHQTSDVQDTSTPTHTSPLLAQDRPMRERVVVLTMVQPRWALLQCVDDVVLLANEHCLYSGTLDNLLALDLLHSGSGLTTVEGVQGNAEDTEEGCSTHADDGHCSCVVCGCEGDETEAALTQSQAEEAAHVTTTSLVAAQQHRIEKLLHSLYHTGSSSSSMGEQQQQQPLTYLAQGEHAGHTRRAITRFLHECAIGSCVLDEGTSTKESPAFVVQLYYMFSYSLRRARSRVLIDVLCFVLLTGLACVLATLYTSLYDMHDTSHGQAAMQTRTGLLFLLMAGTMLHAVVSRETIRKHYASFLWHRAHGYFGAGTFLLYTTLACALVRLCVTCLFALALLVLAHAMLPVHDYAALFPLAVIVAMTSLASYFVVLFVCVLADARGDDAGLDVYILYIVVVVNVLLAGVMLHLPALPRVVRFLSFFTVLRLSYESAVLTQFIDHTFGCDTAYRDVTSHSQDSSRRVSSETSSSNSSSAGICFTGLEYAHFMGFDEHRRWTNVALLAALAASLLMGCFCAMTLYRSRRCMRE